jgi:hypothetical protein
VPAVAIAAAPTIAKLKAQAIYKISVDIASQLKHHDDPDSAFHPDQLAKGIEVEREHSESLPVRKAITKGHLAEFDTYYDPLAKMEEKLKEEKTAAYYLGVYAAIEKLAGAAQARRVAEAITRSKAFTPGVQSLLNTGQETAATLGQGLPRGGVKKLFGNIGNTRTTPTTYAQIENAGAPAQSVLEGAGVLKPNAIERTRRVAAQRMLGLPVG